MGSTADPDMAQRLFDYHPREVSRDRKRLLAIRTRHKKYPIGVIDIVVDTPIFGQVILNLFLIQETEQQKGLGSQVFKLLCEHCLKQFPYLKKIKIAVDDTNYQAMRFLKRVKFTPTDDWFETPAENKRGRMVVLEYLF